MAIFNARVVCFTVLLCLICAGCSGCGMGAHNKSTGYEKTEDASLTDSSEHLPGETLIFDFGVNPCFQTGEMYTEEDEKASLELIRTFRASFAEAKTEEDGFCLSQPFPVLNLNGEVLDAFLFLDGRCVGILSFGATAGEYTGSFVEGEIPELTRFLSDNRSFVLISDGMRLWIVSEQESCPLNLQSMNSPNVQWTDDYMPFSQKLRLTEIEVK